MPSSLHTPYEQYADKGDDENGEGHYAPHEAEVRVTVFHRFILYWGVKGIYEVIEVKAKCY